jgi:tetratricopeptide (TPR) repeat protein
MGRLLKPVLLVAAVVGAGVAVYWLSPAPADSLAAARTALERRDFGAAVRELDTHLAHSPNDTAALLMAAQAARRGGDGPAAEAYLARFQAAGGSPAQADRERELRAWQDGRVGDAGRVLAYCRANPDDPAAPLMLEALARGLLAAGPPPLAVACLDEWLARSLSSADRVQALVWHGEALERLGLAPEAAADYRAALAADPNQSEARLRLARFLTRDQPAEALDHFQHLDRETPDRPEVLLGLARCRRQLGDLEAAADVLTRVRAARPDDPEVLIEAGVLAMDRGRPAEAEPLLRRAVALAPGRRDPNVQLLRCLRELGNAAAVRDQEAVVRAIEDDLQRRIDAIQRKP